MPARVRSKTALYPYKTYSYFDGWVDQTAVLTYEQMSDATGPKPWPNRPMNKSSVSVSGSFTNRPPSKPTSSGDIGYPSQLWLVASSSAQFDPIDTFPSDSALGTALMAATNPGAPSMNLPLFMLELRDIPMMIRHAGDLLHKIKRPVRLMLDAHKEAAAATLAFQFGWKPLIKDLLSMLEFGTYVDRRMSSISKLNAGKGDKRRARIHSASNALDVNLTSLVGRAPSIPGTVKCQRHDVASGVIVWKLRSGQPLIPQSRFAAIKLALGLNLGNIPLTVWNSIPWTWLIDWFTGVSTFLKATANSWQFKAESACIVKKSIIMSQHPDLPVGAPIPTLVAGVRTKKTYSRIPWTPNASINLRIPILDSFKMSILGSLTIVRISGRSS